MWAEILNLCGGLKVTYDGAEHRLQSSVATVTPSSPSSVAWITGPDRLAAIRACILAHAEGRAAILDEAERFKAEAAILPPKLQEDMDARIHFLTSGSMAAPKLIEKPLRYLAAEASTLAKFYGLDRAAGSVVSLVSPLHIYGFIHALLLPCYAACDVHWMHFRDGIWHGDLPQNGKIGLLVVVPTMWSYAKMLLERYEVGTLVSSGAAFGVLRREELRSHPRKPQKAFEIFGSTETGGIAASDLLQVEHPQRFELLPEVELSGSENPYRVTSPFIAEAEGLMLADEIQRLGARELILHGRSDRVIKIGAKRYSLEEIEANLSIAAGGTPAVCLFIRKDELPRGGELIAIFQSAGTELIEAAKLRRNYLARSQAPFPDLLLQIEEFPRLASGKTNLAALTHFAKRSL